MSNDLELAEKLSGSVENIVYHNESNDYTVFELGDESGQLVTAVGNIPQLSEGEVVTLTGSWTYHKEFGKQFAFIGYEKTLPKEIDGIIQYLSSRSVKGIGPVTALKIVNKYGVDTFNVIENHPEWLADIPGITMKKAAVISESFKEQSELRNVMMFFGDQLGTNAATKIYKTMGSGAIGIIKNNPYILCEDDFSISFEKADKIAASLGFSADNEERILSGFKYVLSYNSSTNGHTCLPKEKIISVTSQLLGLDEGLIEVKLSSFIMEEELCEYTFGGCTYVLTKETREDEVYIAKRIHSIDREIARFDHVSIMAMIEMVEQKMGMKYAELQREALYRCLEGGVTLITGGPGTGKTTVVKAIISMFNKLGFYTALCAPTGRAAKRLSETTSEEAKTIHRLLEMERTEVEKMRFNRNSRNPLDQKVVIVDETSMVDLHLMCSLMRALPRGARLILIGDADQLPSVGAGNVLADLISSNAINTVRLTEIFRQSKESLIVTNAHKINAGALPVLNVTDNDFFFVRRENENEIAQTISSLIMQRLPRTYGKSISEGIQVITPSKKGLGGVEVLNKELQGHMNPPSSFKKEKSAHGVVFREGDRVMQTTNNYEIEWEKNGVEGLGIFNGDIGVIESVDFREECLHIRFDDRFVRYGFDNLDELELAYAITVHKSQGSEYPVVIIPMYSCAPMLMTRNLFYTAVTRAKKMVILVGRSDIPSKMVSNNREVLRYTTLCARLREGRGE